MAESDAELHAKIDDLLRRLKESEELLNAIRSGDVDALVVSGPNGDKVYTIDGADYAYRTAVEAMSEGTITLTTDGIIIYCNRRFAEMVRIPMEKAIGASIYKFVPDGGREALRTLLHNADKGEISLLAGDKLLPVYLSASALNIADLNGARSAVIMDLTDQKRSEEMIAAERLARSIIEQAAEAIVVCNAEGKIIRFSRVVSQILGCDPSLQHFDALFKLQGPHGERLDPISDAIQGKTILKLECNFGREKSRMLNLLLNAGPLKNDKNEILGCVITLLDITEHKKADEDLRLAYERLQTFFDHRIGGIGIVIANARGEILQANDYYLAILGYTREEFLSGHIDWRKMTPPEWLPADERALAQLAERGVCDTYEKEYVRRDGIRVPVLITDAMMPGDSGDILAFVLDITERKKADDELQKSERQFRTLIENLSSGVALVDESGKFTIYNPAFLKMFGLSEDADIKNVNDQNWSDWRVYEEDGTLLHVDNHPVRKAAITGRPVRSKLVGVRLPSGGDFTWMQISAVPILKSNGKVERLICTYEDVTERKKAEAKMLQQNKLLEGINRISHEAVTCKTEEELGHVCLSVAEELTGSKVGFIGELHQDGLFYDITISNPGWDLCTLYDNTGHRRPPGQFKIHGLYGHVLETGRSLLTNNPSAHPDSIGIPEGHPPLTTFLGVPLIDSGKTVGLIAVGNREDGYSPEHQEILEALAPAIVQALFRKRAEDGMRKSRDELEQRVQERTAELKQSAEKLEAINVKLIDEIKGHAETESELQAEVEEHKKTEEELAAAKDAAEDAVRAKAAFLANMSHEIRTPMNSIIGFTSLLLMEPLSSEYKDWLENMRMNGEALLALINEVLDFSKMEKEKIELEIHPFDLRQRIEESLDLVSTKAAEKGLDLAYIMDNNVPETIITDPARLRQVLANLLSNAVKFTDSGDILVQVSSKPDGAFHELHFTIQDTGIGMPQDQMSKLFQPFSQINTSISRLNEGTGLGLAISKKLIELMGGRIWAESEEGKGSTFHFTIKAEAETKSGNGKLPAGPQPQFARRTVLIADDNQTIRRLLARQTQSWGMIPIVVSSGSEALEKVLKGVVPDVAILDVGMPGMDGITLAGSIREYERGLPLVMLTSLGQHIPSELSAFRLEKPIKLMQLFNALTSILERRTIREQKQAMAVNRKSFSPLRILLAEDNTPSQMVTLMMLGKLGYRADVAANGLEVLQALERQPYDVVLMDIRMPEMDGYDATKQIRQRWPKDGPRVIAITAYALQGAKEKCLDAGMDDYISKPVNMSELADALSRCPTPPPKNKI